MSGLVIEFGEEWGARRFLAGGATLALTLTLTLTASRPTRLATHRVYTAARRRAPGNPNPNRNSIPNPNPSPNSKPNPNAIPP